jgi:hypothetical protein
MLEGYWGQALHVGRVAAKLSQDEVLTELNKRLDRAISLAMLDGMEKAIEEIDPRTFDIWCELLPWGKTRILKCAQQLQQNAQLSDQELRRRAANELEYQLWRSQPENQ